MTHVDLLHPSDLAPRDVAVWEAMQRAATAFANPLLGPGFARAVGQVRPDARIAIWRDSGGRVRGVAHAITAYKRRAATRCDRQAAA